MRAIVLGAMILGFAVAPVVARGGGAADKAATTVEATATAQPASPAAASKADVPAKPAESNMESELQELRELIEAQSKQIQVQSEALKEQQKQMEVLENRVKISGSSPASENLAAEPALSAVSSSSSSSSSMALSALSPNAAAAGALAKAQKPADDEPPALRFKGITITPGGYMAAETVWRNRAIGSGINSDFKGVPLPGNEQSHISEFNASGRQSRIAMLAQGKLKGITIGGYYEMDFLSAGVTSNDNQSNSYTLRQRQFWGQAKFDSGWTFTGGQMWSLVTETKAGVDNRSEATTQTVDAQYNAGFSWARQYGFRMAKSFNNKLWVAAAIEEAQTTLTAHGQSNNFLVGAFGA